FRVHRRVRQRRRIRGDHVFRHANQHMNVRRLRVGDAGNQVVAVPGTGLQLVLTVVFQAANSEITFRTDGDVDGRRFFLWIVQADPADIGVLGPIVVLIDDGAGDEGAVVARGG